MAWLTALSIAPTSCFAQPKQAWKTGKELQKQRMRPTQVAFRSQLKTSLGRLARLHRVCIHLDRRVDPSRSLNFASENKTFNELLSNIAAQNQLELTWIGPVAYFGPQRQTLVASVLFDIHRKTLDRLPPSIRRKWFQKLAIAWPHLTEPRKLVIDWCRTAKIRVNNPEMIPHDLWAQQQWPSLDLAQRLTLALNGFGLTFDVKSDGNLDIHAIPWDKEVENQYFIAKEMTQLPKEFASYSIRQTGRNILLIGKLNQHVALRDWISRLPSAEKARPKSTAPSNAANADRTVYALSIQNQPFGPMMRALSGKLGLSVSFDPSISHEKLDRLVSFQVENATMTELLGAALEQVQLDFQIQNGAIKIQPKPK